MKTVSTFQAPDRFFALPPPSQEARRGPAGPDQRRGDGERFEPAAPRGQQPERRLPVRSAGAPAPGQSLLQVRARDAAGVPLSELSPADAEARAGEVAKQALKAILKRDMEALRALVHPDKGVRFSPYAYVDPEANQVLKRSEITGAYASRAARTWGSLDGTGDPITLPFADYFYKFVLSHDFAGAKRAAFNTRLGGGNTVDNAKDIYKNAITADFFVPGTPEYADMDWGTLRLVFEPKGDRLYLSGVIRDCWTI